VRDRNFTLDALRLLAAWEVVILHVPYDALPDWLAIGMRLQARWAVPYFFIVSGYFLSHRLADPARPDARPAIYRLIWMFGLWSVLYIPVILLQHDAREVFRRLLFQSFIYTGTVTHLWFLSALVLGFLILLFCFHYRLEKFLPLASALIFLHVLMAGTYDVFGIKFPFEYETARHWTSVPFMFMGVLLARRGPPPLWMAVMLAAGGLALQAVEAYSLYTHFGTSPLNHEILLGTIPFAFGMASLAICRVRFLEAPILSEWGRRYALGIYLLHPLVRSLLGELFGFGRSEPGSWQPTLGQLLYPLELFIISIGILAVIRRFAPGLFNWLHGEHNQTS
jgi:surface polysaccharide O-acyltransferase-like enzyme